MELVRVAWEELQSRCVCKVHGGRMLDRLIPPHRKFMGTFWTVVLNACLSRGREFQAEGAAQGEAQRCESAQQVTKRGAVEYGSFELSGSIN